MAEAYEVGDYVTIDRKGEGKVLNIGERYIEVEITEIDYIADLSPRRLAKIDRQRTALDEERNAEQTVNDQVTSGSGQSSIPGRFISVSDEDVHEILRSEENANTAKKTLYDIKLLRQYLSQPEIGESRDICDIPEEQLFRLLCKFFLGVRKPNGENYEPTTLRGMLASFERYLKKKQYQSSLINDREFFQLRETVKSKQKQLKRNGKGNLPQKADPATDDEIDRLWETRQFGVHTPQSIINTLWFHFTLHFGIRGDTEHRNICWGDVKLQTDGNSDGREYLEFSERQTKTRTGENPRNTRAVTPKMWDDKQNPSRCVVAVYKAYSSLRPAGYSEAGDPFYIATHTTKEIPSLDEQWFRRQPIGRNKISTLIKTMAKNADLPSNRRLTNSSARKSLVQKLSTHNVPPTHIMQITGHKNIQSVNNYSSISESQHRTISSILSSTVSSCTNPPPPTPSTSSTPCEASGYDVTNSNMSCVCSQSHVHGHTSHSSSEMEIVSTSTSVPIFGGPISGGVFNIHIHNTDKRDISERKYRRLRVIESSQSSDEQ